MDDFLSAPKKRKDCVSTIRPCPWVRCKYHLIWDQKIKFNTGLKNPGISDDEIVEKISNMGDNSCALDVAGRGEHTLEEIAGILNITRERTRQIIGSGKKIVKRSALAKLKHKKRSKILYPLWKEHIL